MNFPNSRTVQILIYTLKFVLWVKKVDEILKVWETSIWYKSHNMTQYE